MSIKAVIFDLGGVIVRTEDQTPRRQLASRLGIPPAELSQIIFDSVTAMKASTGLLTTTEHQAAVANTLSLNAAEITSVWDEFWAGDRVDTRLVEYLRSLRPRYKTGLLSNAWDDLRRVITDRWHIEDAFDVIIISAEVGLAKPDHQIYHLLLDRMDVAPDEAVFVDDFPQNIRAAQEVGLHTVHFRSQQQALNDLEGILNANL